MLIDAHHHLARPSLCSYYDRYHEAVEQMAAEYGIDRVCVMGAPAEFEGLAGNREVLDLAAKTDKVLPIAHVDLDRDAPADVGDRDRQGFAGFKAIMVQRPYNADAYMPLYEAVARTGKYLYFHTGMLGGGYRAIDSATARPEYLDRVAHSFPEMPILCAHVGFPWVNSALALLAYHGNVYIDFTGSVLSMDLEWFRSPSCFYRIRWSRVVFGTDSMIRDFSIPYAGYRRLCEFFELDEPQRRAVMGGTMAGILALGGSGRVSPGADG